MANRFQIVISTNKRTKEVLGFAVNDGQTIEEANARPNAAEFPVSLRYDENTQRKRAHKFMEYLNSMVDVMNDLEQDQKI